MPQQSTHKSIIEAHAQPETQPQNLSDDDLLKRMRSLVQKERTLVTEILHHLKEVERRKLYSELGYKSLFNYAVKELGYSEGQAGRRIGAMKLLRELPQKEAKELERKIEDGSLNLTNICQAQSFFNEIKKASTQKPLQMEDKLEILKELEHKSSRQGQAALMEKRQSAGLEVSLPKEKTRALSGEHSELRLVLSRELMAELEEVRALLGQKALGMSWAELIGEMAALSQEALKDKKFGKRRGAVSSTPALKKICVKTPAPEEEYGTSKSTQPEPQPQSSSEQGPTMSSQVKDNIGLKLRSQGKDIVGPKPRSISKGKRYRVWERDGGACVKCGSKAGLQVDHIVPVARGGGCEEENLRLLCVGCNLREGVKEFGLEKMNRRVESRR